MSAALKYAKWCVWEVHPLDFPDPPYYVPLPQYGPWDSEPEAREIAELLTRLHPHNYQLTARPWVRDPEGQSINALV
jgi:hypothetical protein